MKDKHRIGKCPAVFTVIISGNHRTEHLCFQLFTDCLPFQAQRVPEPRGREEQSYPHPAEAAGSQAPSRPRIPAAQASSLPGPAAALTPRPAAPPLVRGTSGYSRTLGSGLRCGHGLRGGGPEGSPSGKEGKQTWGRREPGAAPSARLGPGC